MECDFLIYAVVVVRLRKIFKLVPIGGILYPARSLIQPFGTLCVSYVLSMIWICARRQLLTFLDLCGTSASPWTGPSLRFFSPNNPVAVCVP